MIAAAAAAPFDWGSWWLEHALSWFLSPVVTATVAWLFRRSILKRLDDRLDAVYGHALQADTSATLAAQDASTMRSDIHALERQLSTGELALPTLQQQLEAARRGQL